MMDMWTDRPMGGQLDKPELDFQDMSFVVSSLLS